MFNNTKHTLKYSRNIFKDIITRGYARNVISPMAKTWKILSKDIPGTKKETIYPEHTDVVIIGGGFIGSAAAYWLKSRAVHGLQVVVLEKDLTYQNIQQNKSLGCLTQHFSLIENIKLAQYSSEFFRNIKSLLVKDIDLLYQPTGSLILASEKYADKLQHNATLLKEEGLRLELLSPDQIKNNYPWININDVHLGCAHYESEGTFNVWELLKGYMLKSIDLGAKYVNAEVTGFELERQADILMEGIEPGTYQRLNKVVYTTPDGEERSIKFAACVLAAGDQSANIAKLANIGTGEGLLSYDLPIERREYNVFGIEDMAAELGLCIPMINDTTGIWLRRNGLDPQLLFGMTPSPESSQQSDKEDFYKNIILPSLMNRIPSCSNNKIKYLHTESCDNNTFDESGFIGPHPYYSNLILATGFGKLGCQFSPGIGRAVAEVIIDSHFTTIDFTRFAFDRTLMGEPIMEFNVY